MEVSPQSSVLREAFQGLHPSVGFCFTYSCTAFLGFSSLRRKKFCFNRRQSTWRRWEHTISFLLKAFSLHCFCPFRVFVYPRLIASSSSSSSSFDQQPRIESQPLCCCCTIGRFSIHTLKEPLITRLLWHERRNMSRMTMMLLAVNECFPKWLPIVPRTFIVMFFLRFICRSFDIFISCSFRGFGFFWHERMNKTNIINSLSPEGSWVCCMRVCTGCFR